MERPINRRPDPGENPLVLTTVNERRLRPEEWAFLARRVSPRLLEKAGQYRRWEDRQAYLLGKILLARGLAALGEDASLIHTIQWDRYQRPYLDGETDFNISHTDGLVVCALLKAGRIGIDVENLKPVVIADYKNVFTQEEFQLIHESAHPTYAFYHFWTRKEAVMKADGRGFYLSPDTFSAVSGRVVVGGRQWRIEKLTVPEGYVGHLALPAEECAAVRQSGRRMDGNRLLDNRKL